MPRKKNSSDDLYNRFNDVLSRLEDRQSAFLDKSSNTFNTIYSNITGLDSNLNRITRRFDGILTKAIGHSDMLLANFSDLAESAINIATRTFKSILENALSGLGGGGFLGFLGGLLSFIPFFQEGGVIRGTKRGIPAIVGEKYTSEVILPLEKLEHLLSQKKETEKGSIVIKEGDINIEIKGTLTDRETLREEIFKSATLGRMNAIERALGWLKIEGVENER